MNNKEIITDLLLENNILMNLKKVNCYCFEWRWKKIYWFKRKILL